jgi:hypothetical protein
MLQVLLLSLKYFTTKKRMGYATVIHKKEEKEKRKKKN